MRIFIWFISAFLIVTNFDWFLDVVFNMYESLIFVFDSYPVDYKILAVFALFIYIFFITQRIGD